MKARFYDKIKLEGTRIDLPYGKYTSAQINALLPNGIKSLIVPRNSKVTLYRQDGFAGIRHVITNVAKKDLKVSGFELPFPYPVASVQIECACDVDEGINVVLKIRKEDVTINGQILGYTYYQVLPNPPEEIGEPFGPTNPVVFIIPDYGTDIRIYECIQDKLAQKKVSSILIDYPGIDRSVNATAASNMQYNTLMEYHRTIGQQLDLFKQKPIVMGHGVGGAIAQLWAVTYKFELRNLILIGTAPYGIYTVYNLIQAAVNQFVAGTLPIGQFATIVANATYNTTSEDCQPDSLKLDLSNSISSADPTSLRQIFTQNPNNNAVAQMPQLIRTPTMLVHGTQDINISPTGTDALALLIKCSKTMKFNTCHSPQFTMPKRFFEEFFKFVNPSGDLYFKPLPQQKCGSGCAI